MNKRTLPAIGMILVVMLAGCAGISLFSDDSSDNGTPAHSTDAPSGQTETTTEISYPSGYAASGITDAEKAVEQHTSALFKHNNFTKEQNISDRTSNVTINSTSRIDSANKRAHTVLDIKRAGQQFTVGEYQTKDTNYRKFGLAALDTTHNATNRSFSSFKKNHKRNLSVTKWIGNVSFEGADQVTRAGETLLRYNSTNVTNAEPFTRLGILRKNATINDFNATLLVDQEGVVRSFTYSMTYTEVGVTEQIRISYRITKLNATTVEKPDWVEESKSQSQSQSQAS